MSNTKHPFTGVNGPPNPPSNQDGAEHSWQPWPDPTPEMLENPTFNAIWDVIKKWDIAVPAAYGGYCGATGNHARAIFDALQSPDQDVVILVAEAIDPNAFKDWGSETATQILRQKDAKEIAARVVSALTAAG